MCPFPADVDQLKAWLLTQVPALQPYFDRAPSEFYTDLDNEYAMFSYVVRPYLEELRINGDGALLQHIWDRLEQLARDGTPAIQNELFVGIMEDLSERACFFEYMGPVLRDHWFSNLTWFPEKRDAHTLMNQHVDKDLYSKRWREEISKISGFTKLTEDEEIRITKLLQLEFTIEYP